MRLTGDGNAPRFLALFLALTLALPSPALANSEPSQGTLRAGIEGTVEPELVAGLEDLSLLIAALSPEALQVLVYLAISCGATTIFAILAWLAKRGFSSNPREVNEALKGLKQSGSIEQLPRSRGATKQYRPNGGLEEAETRLAVNQALVVDASVVSRRAGLEKFLAWVPTEPIFGTQVVIFGRGSAAAKEMAARNRNLVVVDSPRPVDLAAALMEIPADQIHILGRRSTVNALGALLPASMEVSWINPAHRLSRILLALGVPRALVEAIDAAGLEQELAREQAA